LNEHLIGINELIQFPGRREGGREVGGGGKVELE